MRIRSRSRASLAFLVAGLKLAAYSLTSVHFVGFVAFLACAAPARAQSLTFTTLAGTAGAYGSADGTGSAARFYDPSGVAVDGSGNVYVADTSNYTIRKSVTTAAPISGDANGDGSVTVADVFYLINNLFAGGPAPISGDANGDGSVTVADVFYLINYLFAGGPGPVSISTVLGTVTDMTQTPIAGATIKVGLLSATSIADGTYTFVVAPGENVKVEASKTGFVNTFDVLNLVDGQSAIVDFALATVGQSNELSNLLAAPATAVDPRGTIVNLPANGLVDSSGGAVDTATVAVTTGMPGDSNYTDNFPGLFVGTQGGTAIAIESFGFTIIDITSGGLRCNLAAGKTAAIAIPVATWADPGTATIAFWSLDEATGKWIYEREATRDASSTPVVYRATVTHFSTFNLDRPIAQAMAFTITVKTSDVQVVPGAGVVITSTGTTGGKWEGRGITGLDGTVRFALVPQGSIAVKAQSGNLTGGGYLYQVNNAEASMTVTLYPSVQKTITVVYNNGTQEVPAPNVNVRVFSDGPGGQGSVNGTTDQNGMVTLSLKEGMLMYNCSASATIGGTSFSFNTSVSTIADIPSRWLMTSTP